MTRKRANDWVNANCKFAAVEDVRIVVRTAAAGAGIARLSDDQVDFLIVRAAVRSILARADLVTLVRQLGLNLDNVVAEAVQKHKKNIVGAVQEVFAILAKDVESLKRTRPNLVTPSFEPRPESENWNVIKRMVLEYAQAHPEAMFEGTPKGFIPPQPERTRANIPMRTDTPPLTIEPGPWQGFHPRVTDRR